MSWAICFMVRQFVINFTANIMDWNENAKEKLRNTKNIVGDYWA